MSSIAHLVLHQPNLPPAALSFSPQTVTLGRAVDCSVPIKDRFLSRHHAELFFDDGNWYVRDLGSVNGTMVNGTRVAGTAPVREGDRIVLGDSEILFSVAVEGSFNSQLIAIDSDSHATQMAIPIHEIDQAARTGVIASLALQFIEERKMSELFDFILDTVMEVLRPSRVALALLGRDGVTYTDVHLRRSDRSDSADLAISRTLLKEVVEKRNVISFVDTGYDEKLARAQSIIGQQIRSAVCAPLLVADDVLGVLYLDFLANRGEVTPDDVRLIAQIARFAAAKLETTRLREEAVLKARMDEELRTAYVIQSRLLPSSLPIVPGYVFAATNRPCRTVSGDYYDVIQRPNGKLYFILADVSGKGVTAALVMSGLATAFSIFVLNDPSPAELVRSLNVTLAPKTAPTKFATLVAGLLDPTTGVVEFTNAGHVSPLLVRSAGTETLSSTDMVVGLFAGAQYRTQRFELEPGDSLILFTDGVTEAANAAEEELGAGPVAECVKTLHGHPATELLSAIDATVHAFSGDCPAGDDVTLFAFTRSV